MDRKSALIDLLNMVAVGDFPADAAGSIFGPDVSILTPYAAFSGSLDAAHSLHKAVVPEMAFSLFQSPEHSYWIATVFTYADGVRRDSAATHSSNPARAWLSAIIDALLSKDSAWSVA